MSEQQNLSEFNRFLINNHQYLIDKHAHYFPKLLTIASLSGQALIDYIFDIFSLEKYRRDKRVHQRIESSLAHNIQQFISDNVERASMPFDAETAIEALTYCIQHNDIFSVQYDIEKPHHSKESPQQHQHPQEQDPSHQHLQAINEANSEDIKPANKAVNQATSSRKKLANPQQIYVNIAKLQQKMQRRQNGLQVRESSEGEGSSYRELRLQPNEFDQHHERMLINLNKDILKKNARIAYFNFCKNQMQLGGNQTFDRLGEQASSMTVGKLLVYAKAYDMMNPTINKQLIMRTFKRISDGKRTIDFEKFYILLNQLQMVDTQLFQRLQLMDEKLQKKLKFVKYPFYTQDQNPRELVVHRSFVKRLTSHSGKTAQDLKDELLTRKSSQLMDYRRNVGKLLNASMVKAPQAITRQREKLISPKDLSSGSKTKDYSIELSFIDKIISPQQTDRKYLGDYEIQHLNRAQHEDNAFRSNTNTKRKDSIVMNIKKRIEQIEASQKEPPRSRILSKRQRYHPPY